MTKQKRRPKKKVSQTDAEAKKERKEFLERFRLAVQAGAGIISNCAKNLGISRVSFYSWVESDAELMAIYLEAVEEVDDFAESELLENVRNKNQRVPPQVQQRAIEYWLNNRRRRKWGRDAIHEGDRFDEPTDIAGIFEKALTDYRQQSGSAGSNAGLPAPNE